MKISVCTDMLFSDLPTHEAIGRVKAAGADAVEFWDMELLRLALLGWGAALYGLEGFLHWGLNHYRSHQDPFKQSVVKIKDTDINALPAGDTHIVYPGKDRPWSSLRLEAQREGFEDYELLRKLRECDPKGAVGIIRKAIRGFDNYTKEARAFRTARKALLDSLT